MVHIIAKLVKTCQHLKLSRVIPSVQLPPLVGIINKVTQGCSRWDDFPCQAGSLETGSPVGGRWKNPIPAEVCWYADDPVIPYNNIAKLSSLGYVVGGIKECMKKLHSHFFA